MIAIRRGPGGAVHLVGTRLVPLPAAVVWGQMRGFAFFVGLDPFHSPIVAADGSPTIGLATLLRIGHHFGPIRFDRVGRVLRWREGAGYSFSDLSRRGNCVGFPHVFTYALCPRGGDACRVTITVRGRWTLRGLPGFAIRAWLRWVIRHTMHSVDEHLLALAVHRRRRSVHAARNLDG